MKGLVTIFGGSGFVGSQIVRALARKGWRLRVAVRRPGHAYRLPMLGDVGQIEIVQANLRNRDSVARALDGAQAAINAVGVLHQHGRQTFEAIHVAGAGVVGEEAAAAGASTLVHISAIGADAASPTAYGRSKAAGEAAALAAFAPTQVLRPAVVFGPEDAFFNRFAAMAMVSPVLPLIGGGVTRFQPVYVGDVAAAAGRILEEVPDRAGTFELGGPGVHSFADLMAILLRVIGRKRILLPLPLPVARVLGVAGDGLAALSLPPPITSDQVAMLATDAVVAAGAAGLAELGLSPTAMAAVLPTYLWRYRKGGQYARSDAVVAG